MTEEPMSQVEHYVFEVEKEPYNPILELCTELLESWWDPRAPQGL